MYFMQYLATIIAWKNAVSEHLEWLKFQKLSGGSACESLRGGGGERGYKRLQCSPHLPAVLDTAYQSVKIRCP